MPENDVNNILLLWIGKVGDFVISTPFIRAVRRKYSNSKITLVLTDVVAPLGEITDEADNVMVFPKKQYGKIIPFIYKLLTTKWDICIDMNPSPSNSAMKVTKFSGATRKITFDHEKNKGYYNETIPEVENNEHMIDRYKRLADFLKLDFEDRLKLYPKEEDFREADRVLNETGLGKEEKFIVIHPGNFKKSYSCWPEENFEELSRRIHDEFGYNQVYIAGPGEEEKVDSMVRTIGRKDVFRAPLMSLRTTSAFLSKASMFIGNSTGTLHIAESVGTPTLSFHKDYSYQCWRPLTKNSIALSSGDWDTVRILPFEDGLEAFYKMEKELEL